MEAMPNKQAAFIEEAKLGYLLYDQRKAGFFAGLGFTPQTSEILREALLGHARDHGVVGTIGTAYGVKYVLVGVLISPNERNPLTRTIWQIDHGDWRPRFVTAYPEG